MTTLPPPPNPGTSNASWKSRAVFTPGNGLLDDFLATRQQRQLVRLDRVFAVLLVAQWAAAVGLAVWVAPIAWNGPVPFVHDHVWASLVLGGVCAVPPVLLAVVRPGAVLTRHVIAVGQMLVGALLIHLTAGRIETHFHIFASLAFLAVYRSWTVLVAAAGVVVVDHVVRGVFAPASVFGGDEMNPFLRAGEHAGWVAVTVGVLILKLRLTNRTLQAVAEEGVRELGQYRLTRRLSSGGMGDVYLAEHRMLKRPCAVKMIRPDLAADPSMLARFEREVRATSLLRHPNTVQVYDYGVARDGTFYYVMEYLPGVAMRTLARRDAPMPAGRVVYLLRQVCGALREAHAAGLVHRDVNPSNVLVCELGGMRDVTKLLDFGLVRPTTPLAGEDRLTRSGTFAGTPEYVAPEQARGEAVDARTDLYGLGGVGYFLLTGRPPFERDNPLDLIVAHCRDPVVSPSDLRPDIPADLSAVILKCLSKNPADRYPDAAALDADLALCGRGRRTDPADSVEFAVGGAELDTSLVIPPPTVMMPVEPIRREPGG